MFRPIGFVFAHEEIKKQVNERILNGFVAVMLSVKALLSFGSGVTVTTV